MLNRPDTHGLKSRSSGHIARARVAFADLSRADPNDVEHELDGRLPAAFLDRFPGQDRIAISAEFYVAPNSGWYPHA